MSFGYHPGKIFERLLPAKLRRQDPPMLDAEYIALFARITDTDPTWRAVMEFGRHRFHQRAAIVQDRSQSRELRLEAMISALDLAGFLQELENEREAQRKRLEERQRQ